MRLKPLRIAATLAVLIAAAALFNPSAEQHRSQIKKVMAERSQIAALLRLGDMAAFVSNYHSLGLASYTTVNGKLLSVGAVGVVVVLEPDRGN
ncbi:MAG: hypothetical protein U1E77_21630 [Inhella sp.]